MNTNAIFSNLLGPTPYTFVGIFSLPPPFLLERNPSLYASQMAMMPRNAHCGTCEICGTAIMHNYLIKDANGNLHSVGSECVKKVGSEGVVTGLRREIVEYKREQRRLDRDRAFRLAREAKEEQRRIMREKEIEALYGLTVPQFDDICQYHSGQTFYWPSYGRFAVADCMKGFDALAWVQAGKQTVEGIVSHIRSERSRFAYNKMEHKMLLDCGSFKLWMTCPKDVHAGDTILVSADLQPSDKIGFGFGKRPKLVKILAQAA